MSYKYETQYDSPNYTLGADAPRVWGRPYKVTAIAIHWWGDPNNKPSYEGVIAYLCRASSGVSAHFVATGTGRRAAQLIDLRNASWATNSANPYTVSIECDPRARNEDYDVVAELIANIRSVYGNIPLVPHRQFVATACPGVYDLNRLNNLANTKDGSGDWGVVKNKVTKPVPAPTPVPTPTPPVVTPPVVVVPTPETPPEAPESPPKPSEPETGTTKPDEPVKPTQSLSELLRLIWKAILKFLNS